MIRRYAHGFEGSAAAHPAVECHADNLCIEGADMEASNPNKIKPMGMMSSLMFFGIPSAIFSFCIYYVMQKLHQNGINDIVNFFASMVAPLLLMTIAALVAFMIEGHGFNWPNVAARFRLKKMTKVDWIYAIGLLIVTIFIYESLSFTPKWLIQFQLFSPPEFLLPAVDPRLDQNILLSTFMGIPLKGQWWIALIYLIFLLFNIVGEEIWWRGYILPRQELVFKKWTWFVHGALWGLFHVFWKWNLIILLPSCLALSFVVHKRKNTWIGIISHMAFNSAPLIGIIIGIIG